MKIIYFLFVINLGSFFNRVVVNVELLLQLCYERWSQVVFLEDDDKESHQLSSSSPLINT